ncbi:GNAT family N-acetyltransferase [Streptomyces sp. VRA16 Mangrove soil]|uniref:GNAT family N-acetyltransferase n=1 Tax=Streptomyces sp. VRA16 Mangrove soil TaxID=2817434 RepID=UPI001A9F1EE3|nr:GNAT family protein [Streptomyces sp. VRA16 Mangrove soil]MBO1337542.1 GNAT family N-acetyltransferase [Streptomyces sp. VRA16 Mangrove soil]
MLIAPDIEVRRATADDAQALADAVIRNKEHLRATEPYRAPDYYTAKAQEARITAENAVVWLLFEGERVVGRVELTGIVMGPLCGASVGYWVDGDYRGRGLIPAAVEEIVREARDDLGLHRLEAGTLVDNTASQRVLAKCGFERFGLAPKYLHINGAWRDHVLFQRLLHDDAPRHIPK